MSSERVPPQLAELQRDFTLALRRPLVVRGGQWSPDLVHPGGALAGVPAHSIAIYNRQYWLRLFAAAQDRYPLVGRLVGLFSFNGLVQRFFLEAPPSHPDLARVAGALGSWLSAGNVDEPALRKIPAQALADAVALDEAHARLLSSERVRHWQPSAEEAQRLPWARLALARSSALVEQGWPLSDLRRALVMEPTIEHAALPSAHPRRVQHLLLRVAEGIMDVSLSPLEASLLQLLQTHPLEDALAVLAEASATNSTELEREVRSFLARAVALGVISGVRE